MHKAMAQVVRMQNNRFKVRWFQKLLCSVGEASEFDAYFFLNLKPPLGVWGRSFVRMVFLVIFKLIHLLPVLP